MFELCMELGGSVLLAFLAGPRLRLHGVRGAGVWINLRPFSDPKASAKRMLYKPQLREKLLCKGG